MSTSTPAQESPRIPWSFLGGVLTLLIGFGISYFGGFFFNGGRTQVPPTDKVPYLALVGLGVAIFALGGFWMARMEQLRGPDLSLAIVAFIMTPLPSLAALLFNYVGNYLRRTGSTAVQGILIGVGIFLLAVAGNWAWGVHHTRVVGVNVRAFVWPVLADFGVVCLVLAALPMLARTEPAATLTPSEPDQARA
jgi:hypothetical protein